MTFYHISEDGNPRPCQAMENGNPCPLRADAAHHYQSKTEARTAYIRAQQPDTVSAKTSFTYAKYLIQNDRMHNSGEVSPEIEEYYYNSPAGRLELLRRRQGKYTDRDKDAIQEAIDNPEFVPRSPKVDEADYRQRVKHGKELLFADKTYNGGHRWEPQRTDIRHALIDYSHKWLSKLSTAEQEAIANITSGGFQNIRYAAGGEKPELFHIPNEDRIWDKYKNPEEEIATRQKTISQQLLRTTMSAMEKAPRAPHPFKIFRGVGMEEFKQQFDVENLSSYVGKELPKTSFMSKIPQSASVDPSIAGSFSGRNSEWKDEKMEEDVSVVYEITQKTIASPVNVSAWSTSEQEVFTNPHSTYIVRNTRTITKPPDPKDHGDFTETTYVMELEEMPK